MLSVPMATAGRLLVPTRLSLKRYCIFYHCVPWTHVWYVASNILCGLWSADAKKVHHPLQVVLIFKAEASPGHVCHDRSFILNIKTVFLLGWLNMNGFMLFIWGSQIGLVLQLKALGQGSCFRWPPSPLTWVVWFPVSIAHPPISSAGSGTQCLWNKPLFALGLCSDWWLFLATSAGSHFSRRISSVI